MSEDKGNQEHWLPVVGYEESYEVSSEGRVRSVDRVVLRGAVRVRLKGRVLRGSKIMGYPAVSLSAGGKGVGYLIHRLVLTAFVGPCPEGMECLHQGGSRLNPCLKNLRWGTRAENERDKKDYGKDNRGERNGQAVLSESDVVEIRRAAASGLSHSKIAESYPVCRETISHAVRGATWKHLLEEEKSS